MIELQPKMVHSSSCRCLKAANIGDLQFRRSNARTVGKLWLEKISFHAANEGHEEVLQWAWEQGCPSLDVWTCTAAAGNGHLAVLRWARRHGCDILWSASTCAAAAAGAHLAVLQYAHQDGCTWNASTCEAAA